VHAPKLLFLQMVVVGVVNQSEKKQMTHAMMMPMMNAMIIYVLIQMMHSMMMN
jgi:hypothetical protein